MGGQLGRRGSGDARLRIVVPLVRAGLGLSSFPDERVGPRHEGEPGPGEHSLEASNRRISYGFGDGPLVWHDRNVGDAKGGRERGWSAAVGCKFGDRIKTVPLQRRDT